MIRILPCITYNLIKHQSFVYIQLNDQAVLFQTIQFSISHLFAYSLNVKQFYFNRALSGATTLGQSGTGNDDIDRVLQISQVPELMDPHHQIV